MGENGEPAGKDLAEATGEQIGADDARHMKRLAWERLMWMLRNEKLSAADLLRVMAAEMPAYDAQHGDLVLTVREEAADDA